jgi:hypothetical protein
MVRIRKLQRKGEDGRWHSDAYAIELRDKVILRYSLAWEFLGSRYNQMIQEKDLSLEQLDQILTDDSLRWLSVEKLEVDTEEALNVLDCECHVPQPATILKSRGTQTEPVTLEAHVVGGRLQISAPPISTIRAQGDRIYLEDGRQLQIALANEEEQSAEQFDSV